MSPQVPILFAQTFEEKHGMSSVTSTQKKVCWFLPVIPATKELEVGESRV
jgi:hypothetical protein